MDMRELNIASPDTARRLLGCELVRLIDGEQVWVKIVETEYYDQTDAASHSYRGRTPRTEIMFGPAGYLYVYFTYGMHYCCNIVLGEEGAGAAALIRAVEPLTGIDTLMRRRKRSGVELTNGPAKLCSAMGIDRGLNGHNLTQAPLRLEMEPELDASAVTTTTRVGISQAVDMPWRFYISDNLYVSRK